MPSLAEGIQYVGMIRQTQADCDYILTDLKGVVDCFSSGITSLLNLPTSLFKDSDVNIQILAPELIKIFSATDKKRTLLSKFQEPGGQKLAFIVPKDFAQHTMSENKKNARDLSKNMQTKGSSPNSPQKKSKNPTYRDLNKDLNKHNGIASKQITPQQLLQTYEYRECETKQTVKCEILDPSYGEEHKDIEPLKIRVFKITGINMKRAGSGVDQSSDLGDQYNNSHSGNSLDYKESKGLTPGETKHEEKQELMNFVVNSQQDQRMGKTPQPPAKEEEQNQANRHEETKTTEKVPGNTLTTEGRAETLEAKPVLKVKLAADPKTGEIRKTAKEVFSVSSGKKDEKKESTEEAKSMQSAEHPTIGQVGRTGSELKDKPDAKITTPPKHEETKKEEIKKEEEKKEEETPRMDLGNLKSPAEFGVAASHIAEENTVHPPDESLFESESGKSTGKANVKEIGKEEKKARMHISTGKILDDSKLGAKKVQEDKKANTVIDEKSVSKEQKKKGGSKKDEFELSDYNESSVKQNADEEEKEDVIENKEEVVPLDKAKIDMKIAQAAVEPKSVKVPSVIDDIVTLAHKQTGEDKKQKSHETLSLASKDKPKLEEEVKSEKKPSPEHLESRSEQQKVTEINIETEKQEFDNKVERQISKDSKGPPKESISITNQEEAKKQLGHQRRSIKTQKRYQSKIITNPMYDADGREISEYPEYKPTEDEMKVRRSLLAFERKKNKEKKKGEKEKKEEKKEEDKDENGEEKKEESKEGDEEDEEKEDKKEEKDDDDGEENQDTQSSVTSGSTGSTMRSFYSLRAAIDEKYVPLSIRNMSCSANIVFLLLLGLASIFLI